MDLIRRDFLNDPEDLDLFSWCVFFLKYGWYHMGVSENGGFSPQIIHFHRVFPLFSPSILGYPYFWKHPYGKSPFFTTIWGAYMLFASSKHLNAANPRKILAGLWVSGRFSESLLPLLPQSRGATLQFDSIIIENDVQNTRLMILTRSCKTFCSFHALHKPGVKIYVPGDSN